jgi:hypothetical protein
MPLRISRFYYQSFFKNFDTQTTILDASQVVKIVPAKKDALLKTIRLPASGIANIRSGLMKPLCKSPGKFFLAQGSGDSDEYFVVFIGN